MVKYTDKEEGTVIDLAYCSLPMFGFVDDKKNHGENKLRVLFVSFMQQFILLLLLWFWKDGDKMGRFGCKYY